MTSRFSRLSVLACITALTGALFSVVPTSSTAATSGATIVASKIAYYPFDARPAVNGYPTRVPVKCVSTGRSCTGTVRFYNGVDLGVLSTYTVAKGTTGYIYPNIPQSIVSSANPVRIVLDQRLPVNPAGVFVPITIEPVQAEREITSTVTGPATGLSGLKVNLLVPRGNQLVKAASRAVSPGGTVSFGNVDLGYNNTPITNYRFSISALVNGSYREYFWRGDGNAGTSKSGAQTGRTADAVLVGSGAGAFRVNFNFGTVTGAVSQGNSNSPVIGTKVTVTGAPAWMPSRTEESKALDIPFCADSYGSDVVDTVDGHYDVYFVPKTVEPSYIINAKPASGTGSKLWNNDFGSCIAARGYANGVLGLKTFTGSTLAFNPVMDNKDTTLSGHVSPATAPYGADLLIDVREKVPGLPFLQWPVVARTFANSSYNYTVEGLAPGKYAVSSGRREDCADGVLKWYRSRYSNNASHFTGESDRSTEIWKSFYTIYSIPSSFRSIAYAHGAGEAQQHAPGGGYAGWMYRDACNHATEGALREIQLPSGGPTLNLSARKGSTVSGKIKRDGGRTVKEMLVTVYSTQGTLVQRSAFSDSSGNFTIRGVQAGNYNVVVNSDSWRGLGRTFTGVHTKRVGTGGSYSVGTLTAKF